MPGDPGICRGLRPGDPGILIPGGTVLLGFNTVLISFTKVSVGFYWLSSSLMRILNFSFDGGTANVTKWHSSWSPGLILGAFWTIFRAGPVWSGPGAKFGRKPAKHDFVFYNFYYLV